MSLLFNYFIFMKTLRAKLQQAIFYDADKWEKV